MSEKVNQLPNLDIEIIQKMIGEARGLNKEASELREHLGIHDDQTDDSNSTSGLSATPEAKDPKLSEFETSPRQISRSSTGKQSARMQETDAQSQVKPSEQASSAQSTETSLRSKSATTDQEPKPKTAAKKSTQHTKSTQRKPSSVRSETGKKTTTSQQSSTLNKNATSDSSDKSNEDYDQVTDHMQEAIKSFNQRLQDWQITVDQRLDRVVSETAVNHSSTLSESTGKNVLASANTSTTSSTEQLIDFENALSRLGSEVNELVQKLGDIPGVNPDALNFVQKLSSVAIRKTDPETGDTRRKEVKKREKRKNHRRPPKRKDSHSSFITRGVSRLVRQAEREGRTP